MRLGLRELGCGHKHTLFKIVSVKEKPYSEMASFWHFFCFTFVHNMGQKQIVCG